MYNGLRIGTTGMKSSQRVMDNVADQIANVNTNGYKKKEVVFKDLLRNEVGKNHVMVSQNAGVVSIGAGSRGEVVKTNFTQGVIIPSEGPFHMALEGHGFFGVRTEANELLYTRNGAFQANGDGSITDQNGRFLEMEKTIPVSEWGDLNRVSINADGVVQGKDATGATMNLGRVRVFVPDNNDDMLSFGGGLYNSNKGDLRANTGGGDGFPKISQNALEGGNINLAESMTEMIITQRAYQANAKSISTADEMLEVINTIL